MESDGHVTHLLPGFRRETEDTGAASGKDGDAQWKRWGWLVEKMGMASSSTILSPLSRDRGGDKATRKNAANGHVFSDSRRPSLLRVDGDAQWKRWGRPVEKMGTLNGSDGDG